MQETYPEFISEIKELIFYSFSIDQSGLSGQMMNDQGLETSHSLGGNSKYSLRKLDLPCPCVLKRKAPKVGLFSPSGFLAWPDLGQFSNR
jgi:hypothetical protein